MSDRPLTPKQQRFVKEYVATGNASEAARRAGYSEKTADVIGHENLKKPQINLAIQKEADKAAERTEVTQDWVLQRLREEATYNLDDPLQVIASSASRVSALNVLSKCLAMQVTKHEGKIDSDVKVTRSEEDLARGLTERGIDPDLIAPVTHEQSGRA